MIRNSRGLHALTVAFAALIGTSVVGPASAGERTLVAAKSDADYLALRAEAEASGARILKDMRQIGMLVIDADANAKTAINK